MRAAWDSVDDYRKTSVVAAFTLGVLLTLGFKDFYPDLEQQYWRWKTGRAYRTRPSVSQRNTKIILEDDTVERPVEPKADNRNVESESAEHPAANLGIRHGIEGTIGNTPLIRIKSLSEATGCEILAKAEFVNGAGGSPKDRVALKKDGLLTPYSGDTIYEGTVGSTGISLATICTARGYKAHICMPSDQSVEKAAHLAKLGAIITRNDPVSIVDSSHYVNKARALAAAHTADPKLQGRGFFADQFETPYNYLAHLHGTGPEIYQQTGGKVDAFVAGAGTGGTISGVALYLKPRIPECKIILADPQGSGLFNKVKYGVMFSPTEREGTRRRHQVDSIVEGVGVNRITANFEKGRPLIDDAVRVTDQQVVNMSRWLVSKDGIFVGSSSCVNVVAAVQTALQLGKGKTVVTILCDCGMRHLSKLWKDDDDTAKYDSMTLEEVLA